MEITRRKFLKKCSILAGGITLAGTAGVHAATLFSNKSVTAAVGKKRPNIIILLADDMGYSDLGCYDSEYIKTPNIDKLASQGVKFTNSYAAAPNCSPARAGFLTGRIASRTGMYSYVPDTAHPMCLRQYEITLPTLLKQAGYETAHFGKWHLAGATDPSYPNDHGFDYTFGTEAHAMKNGVAYYKDPDNYWRNGVPVGSLTGYACEVVTDGAIDWIENRRQCPDKPFFQFVCFHEPHRPVLPAEDLPADIMAMYPPPLDQTSETGARYYANITNLDRHIGRFLDKLDQMHLSENTFVAFLSDNGPWRNGSQGPLRDKKSFVFEGGIRTPGIIRWPGHSKAETVCDEPISFVDFLPTFCEITGAPVPNDRTIDGASFLPVFKGNRIHRTIPLFWYFYRKEHQAAMRMGDWVMIGVLDGTVPQNAQNHPFMCTHMNFLKTTTLVNFQLYNLRDDIGQQQDLAFVETKRFNAMKKKMIDLHQSVIAEGPTWPETAFNGTIWDDCPG